MDSAECVKILAFNDSLEVGQRVRIRWTNSHSYYSAIGVIRKLNTKTARIALEEEVKASYGSWPVGHILTIPRPIPFEAAFTNNNGIFPLEGQ